MTYKEQSYKTKKKLSKALKKIMESKPFSKISIVDIVSETKVNRKTFYYHFENVLELLKWTLEQEAIDIVKEINLLVNFEDALNFVIDYITANKIMFNCAFETLDREQLRAMFASDFIYIIRNMIDNCEKQLNLCVPDDFKSFYTSFYTEAIASTLLDFFKGTNLFKRKDVIKYLKILCEENMVFLLKRASAEL